MNLFNFYKSFPQRNDIDQKPEIVLLGKSNVGKSSFINTVTNTNNLAKISQKPGKTQLLNYYWYKDEKFLVDTPGYGYHAAGKGLTKVFSKMMEGYFNNNENLIAAFLILDMRREVSVDDQNIIDLINNLNIPLYIVFNKIDKLKKNDFHNRRRLLINKYGLENQKTFFASLTNKINTNSLIEVLKNLLS